MNYHKISKEILRLIGGKENVAHLEHCSTRLRFTLKDNTKANIKELEQVDGVIGVRQNVQCQVIIGNEVVEVYDEIMSLLGSSQKDKPSEIQKEKQSIGKVILDFVISIFQPLVPAVAGGGILKSILILLSTIGIMDAESSTYQLLNAIGQAPLYFLPLLVAMTTANKLKVNPLLAVSAVGTLILPAVTGMLAEGATLLTFNVQAIDYSSQVFPAILTVLFYSVMEKFFTKHSPKAIRVFFVPMISLLLTVPVGLLILGPLGYNVGSLFSSFIVGLYTNFGWIATALLAGILPLMVVTGMHKALLPYAVDQFAKNGYEILYVAASLAHNVSEAGATFAVALKSKDKKLKATAFSAGISALFGITEPALYGVTILHKKVLYSVMVSSFISGAIGGLLMIRGFALVGPGIASVTMFIDPENSMNFVWAMIVFALTFVLSFVSTFFFFKDTEIEEIEESLVTNSINLAAPVKGTIIPLSTVKDEVFSSGMVGAGVGIIPEEGIVYAPEAGEVTMVFGTNHALGMKLANGAELLIHVGIDTVQMNGEGFTSFVKTGDYVEKGQQLLSFEIEKIQAAHLDPTIICVVTNKDDYKINSDDSITKLFSVATI